MLEKSLKIDVKRVVAITLTYNRTYPSYPGSVFSETKTYRSPEAAARQWADVKSTEKSKSIAHTKERKKKLLRRSLPIFKKLFDA